jgi:uncharacterized protein with GYD domain
LLERRSAAREQTSIVSIRRAAMATYIMLANFTDQGIRGVKETPKRAEAFAQLCEKVGVKLKETYRTMGHYDVVAIVDAPDDVTMSALLYGVGSLGNIRTETLRAFTLQETKAALAKMA